MDGFLLNSWQNMIHKKGEAGKTHHVAMGVLADGSELAVAGGHEVLAQAALVVRVQLRQVLLHVPHLATQGEI